MVLLISCVWINGKKPLWTDELTCVYLIQDHSLGHMLQALAGGADVVPPLYYLSAWTWARVAGVSGLSLRLHSWLWVSIGFALIWGVARRWYGYWPASVGCVAAFCLSRLVLYHNSEVRFYGFFLGVVAFGVWVFDRINESDHLTWRQGALIALAHACLIYSHVFGVLYSGCILLAWIVADAWHQRWRPAVYVAVVIGWLAFLPWLPIFRHQTGIFGFASWIPTPTVNDLLEAFGHKIYIPLALVLIGGVALLNGRQKRVKALRQQTSAQEALFVLAVIFIVLVPVVVWFFSRQFKSVFWDRYMIPSTLGWAIVLSFICEELGMGVGGTEESRPREVTGRLLLTALLVFPIFHALMHPRIPRPDAERFPASLQGLPIALQTPHVFLPRMYYLGASNNYYYVLDWEASKDPRSDRGSNIDDQSVDGTRRYYPLPHVVSTAEFLALSPRFLYFDQHMSAWLDIRIRESGQYKLTPIPRNTPGMYLVDDGNTQVWLVERIGSAKPATLGN